MQKTMKAVAIDEFGGPLKVKKLPVPEVGADEVLIHVEAAGVGVWDPFEREGGFAEMMDEKPRFPYVLGSEGAGEVVAVGDKVSDFKKGDKVFGTSLLDPKGGFYAEYAPVKAELASRVPEGLTTEQASVVPIDGVTGLRGLDDTLGLKSGESVMIFGAGGGIGHMAVQLAKRMGARVFAVASGRDGVELARRVGADAAVDGRKDDVLAAARDFAPDGLDAALLTAGGDVANRALSAVRDGGRVAHPNGVQPTPQARPDVKIENYDGDPDGAIVKKLNELINAGPFEVHVARTFPLEKAADAHRALDDHYLGKLALSTS